MEQGDFSAFAKVSQTAYPGAYRVDEDTHDEIVKNLEKFESAYDLTYIGAYINDKLVGGMRFYTFEMNFHGEFITASGIGSVAVDLIHKKQHVAQTLIQYASERSIELGIPIIMLYPFDAAFYHNFGYGYGVPLYNYKIAPLNFKDFKIRDGLSYLDGFNFEPLEDCYNEQVKNNHGMMYKSTIDKFKIERIKEGRILVYKENDVITGYMIFSQEAITKDNILRQAMLVSEIVYNTPAALKAFSSFFHTQKDQVEYIELHTFDERFYQFLCGNGFVPDPLHLPLISHKINNTSLGMMYMALDPAELIEWVEERVEENLVFNIISPQHGSDEQTVESFEINPGYLEKLEIDFSLQSFTSWVMGTISLEQLYFQGNVSCALPQKLKALDRKFNLDTPKCLNTF